MLSLHINQCKSMLILMITCNLSSIHDKSDAQSAGLIARDWKAAVEGALFRTSDCLQFGVRFRLRQMLWSSSAEREAPESVAFYLQKSSLDLTCVHRNEVICPMAWVRVINHVKRRLIFRHGEAGHLASPMQCQRLGRLRAAVLTSLFF